MQNQKMNGPAPTEGLGRFPTRLVGPVVQAPAVAG
jgi:hypothetical protein